jgi:hypothetical protein
MWWIIRRPILWFMSRAQQHLAFAAFGLDLRPAGFMT